MTALAGLDGEKVTLTEEHLDRLPGRVLRPGDTGFAEAVTIWNGLSQTTPAVVVQPATADDVSATVNFARNHRLSLSVKGGGHNIAGTALAEAGLTLDMSLLRDVRVDPAARRVVVGAGCLLQDVDRATQEYGLATVLGFVSEVGVAGLTLGGGFGYLMRRFGWAADNLLEVEIVTADGVVRTASRSEHPDLFWAVRGGGGNLGVVTRFTFALHEVGPTITGGLILWDAAEAEHLLDGYRSITESASRELTAALVVRLAPAAPFVPPEWHGRPVVGMLVCHSGPDPTTEIKDIRSLGTPIVDLVTEKPYVDQQSMMDGTEPKGAHYLWRTEFLPSLDSGFLNAFRTHALRVPNCASESVIFHVGGAVNERAGDDGAVGNRDVRYVTGFAGSWEPGEDAAPHRHWVREAWAAIRPYGSGNYVNFQLAGDDEARTAAAYGANLARLRRVKAVYDPVNLFRRNRNVPPG